MQPKANLPGPSIGDYNIPYESLRSNAKQQIELSSEKMNSIRKYEIQKNIDLSKSQAQKHCPNSLNKISETAYENEAN